MTSLGPQSTDPIGAPSPFDRQNMSVSAGAASSAGLTPSATAAFQMRAPSTCTASPASRAGFVTASTSARDSGRPLAGMCVFSSVSALITGRWCSWSATAAATSAGSSDPSSSASGCSWSPASVAVAACS